MNRYWLPLLAAGVLAGLSTGWAQPLSPGKNAVTVRGQRQDVYFYPAPAGGSKGTVLFAPGDGGWRGFGITMAETIAGWGYNVYGLDTKRYLESFTTSKSKLTEPDVMADFRVIAGRVARGPSDKVILAGWSEGAGLMLLAAAAGDKKLYRGVVAIGLPQSSVLGWRWADNVTYVTKQEPKEPHFPSMPYLPKVASLPLFLIASTRDEYTSSAVTKNMFAAAGEPKKIAWVEADDHRFTGNRDAFFRTLREALEWTSQPR